MKVEKIIEGLEKAKNDCADNIQKYYHEDHHEKYHSLSSAIAFLKAYQDRVEELEEAIDAMKKIAEIPCDTKTFQNIVIAQISLEKEVAILKFFYEEGDGLFEEEKPEKKGYDHNSKDRPSRLPFQTFA